MKKKITDMVFKFFIDSSDFNGIPLRQISTDLKINYSNSIDLIKEIVLEGNISIQSSTNPNIIGFQHYPIDSQIKILEEAKNYEVKKRKIGAITLVSENTDFPICLYPSKQILELNRDFSLIKGSPFKLELSLAEPQLKPLFFEIEVLERYFNDPRYNFKFKDYSGSISCKYDENDKPILRDEDQIFLKTFGLGLDSENNRLAVVYLRYLNGLTKEHQVYWKSKEVKGSCKMLKEYHDNTIQGSWTFSYSIFTGFIGELNLLNEISEMIFGKKLFHKGFDKDNRPKEFTFFFTPTLKNYNEFILLLDKMISENINKDFFEGKIEMYEFETIENDLVERKNKGTLRLFEEWLLSNYNIEQKNIIKEIFKPLKKIRRERQNPAHRIDENKYDKQYINKQKELIKAAYSSIRAFRGIFQQHPKAINIEIPDWLENGDIKTF